MTTLISEDQIMAEGQQDLLSTSPIARREDYHTSHQAAAEITASGKRATQQHQALEAVKALPLSTSAELAKATGGDRYMFARRLPELREAGLVVVRGSRRCTVTGKQAVSWEAA